MASLDMLSKFSWDKFDTVRPKAFDICKQAMTTFGIVPSIDTEVAPGFRTMICNLRTEGSSDAVLAFTLLKDAPEIWISTGCSFNTDAGITDLCLRAMKDFRIGVYRTAGDLEVRYAVCLGTLTIETVRIAATRVIDTMNWVAPQIGSKHIQAIGSVARIDAHQESKRIEKVLKDAAMKVRTSRKGLNEWLVIFTSPDRPETEFAVICNGDRPDMAVAAGTPIPDGVSKDDAKIADILEIARRDSVAIEFKTPTEVRCYYSLLPSGLDRVSQTVCFSKSLIATTHIRQYLGLTPKS